MGPKEYFELAGKYGFPSLILFIAVTVFYRFIHYSLWPFIVAYFKTTQETQLKQYIDSQDMLRHQLEEMQKARLADQERSRSRDEQFLAAFANRDQLARDVARDTTNAMGALTAEIKVLTESLRRQKK